LLQWRNLPESQNPLAASAGCKSAPPAPISEPRVRAFARVPRGARRRARCIPALPLLTYSGSGFAETNAILGSSCLHPPGCPSPDTELVNADPNDGRVESNAPPARDFIETGSPVTPFVCALVPGTTRRHAHAVPTALLERHPVPGDHVARGQGPGDAWSYWEHSRQSAAFQSPADLRRHRTPLRPPHSLRG